DNFVIAGKRVVGCFMGATRLRVDVPRLVALYQQGRLKLDELITARYPLEQINEAIAVMERGDALRNVIVFAPDARGDRDLSPGAESEEKAGREVQHTARTGAMGVTGASTG